MEDEIDLIIEDENEKTYLLEVPRRIKYGYLKDMINTKVIKSYHFNVIFRNKKYENLNEIINFNQGDRVFIERTVILENYTECNFYKNINLNEADMKVYELSGILQLCLIKHISRFISNLNVIQNEEIREIIKELQKGVEMTENPQKDIKESLSQKNGNNILTYASYLKEVISSKEILNLISLFDKNMQNQMIAFWSILSKYEFFNLSFEREFSKMIEKSYFDYSLVGVSIFQHSRAKQFLQNLKECENCEIKFLLHGTEIDPISKIITSDFKYARKPFYGMGVYFSDMIDYISFYSKYEKDGTRSNWAIITPVGETISCVGTQVFYNKSNKKNIYSREYEVNELDHFPSYDEILKSYPEKMVKKNGIHIVSVEPSGGDVIKSQGAVQKAKKEGKFIGSEYVITEMDQMLPLYGLTLRRNEYFILWRDGNFNSKNEWTDYLKQRKMFIYKYTKMNVFFESNTEKALEMIKRKKYNKIILISSCQGDVGIKFVNVVRKILGFDIVVLFYSANINNLQWIQKYPNALYTNNEIFFRKYILNYDLNGLNQLKNEMEKYYKCRLNLNNNCLDYPYPKLAASKTYEQLLFEESNQYFRKVIIKNRINNKVLYMDKKRPQFLDHHGVETNLFTWYVIIYNGEITLFSNGYYLFIDQNKNVIATELMKGWKYEIINSKFLFYYQNKNFVLTLSDNNVVLRKEDSNKNNQLFSLVENL